ncbi:MAG: hypothetical protein U9Q05_12015, partial [Thermodesulfobacteriota bacterium]|nr:hypothetical protein [Thermodesulfobacteriota bacterium]
EALLKRLNGQGMTVIMVTHSTDCAGYARRRLELSDGKLVESFDIDPSAVDSHYDTFLSKRGLTSRDFEAELKKTGYSC